MKLHRWLTIVLCWPWLCASQDNPSLVSRDLAKLIPEIEAFYNVRFSYVDEVIADKFIDLSDYQELDFRESIDQLEKLTRLKFEIVDDSNVIIRPFTSDDLVSVCGNVSDAFGNPLIGVTVAYSNQSGGLTDEQGFFNIDSIPFSSTLTLRYVGYQMKQVYLSEATLFDCFEIQLRESVQILEEVIVRDYLATGIIKRRKDIEIYPQQLKSLTGLIEPDILQTLQQSPGVNSPFETAAGLYVRGGSPDQNLILWNGIKTYNQGHFFGMISAFNPYITEEVKFIKNGTSAEFGDRVSSVVDIRSRQSVANDFSGGAGFNMLYGDAFLNIPVINNKLSLQLSARRSFTDMIETFTYSQMADRVFQNTKISETTSTGNQSNNQFFFNDFTSNLVWEPNSSDRITINTLYNKNDLDFSSSDDSGMQTFNDKLFNANEGLNLSWTRNSGNSFSFDMDVNYAKYLLKYEFATTASDTTEISSKKNSVADLGYRFNSVYKIDEQQSIKAGYHYSNNQIQYAYESITPLYELVLDTDDSQINTHSLYSQYMYDNSDFNLQAGVRLNHYAELDKSFLEPRLFVEKRISDRIKINASGEYRTQVASQIKESVVSDLSLENKVWALSSNDRFPVIKSYQVTLGSNFNRAGWYVDVEGYRKQIDDVTTLTFGFLNPIDNVFRRGDSKILGTDLFVKKQFSNYESWLGYSYIRSENEFRGLNNDEPFPGNWNIEHTIKWSHIIEIKNWEFSLGWIWHTGKSFTDVTESTASAGPISIEFSSLNGNNLPVYHRLDFSVIYEFESKNNQRLRYRLGLSVLNAYNRRNTLNREFRTTPSLENELIDTRVFSLGFTPNLVFRIFW